MFNLNTEKQNKTISDSKGHYAPTMFLDYFRFGVGSWKPVPAIGDFTLTAVPANGETMTIGTRTYTFRTALTVATNEIKIGTLSETQVNIVDAINGNQYTVGVTYNALPNEFVTIGNFSANVARLTALTGGTAGNSIVTTETIATGGSFGGATLSGGANETSNNGILKPLSETYNTSSESGVTSQGLAQAHYGVTSLLKRYASMDLSYDDLLYTANATKNIGLLGYTGSNYRKISKLNISSFLNGGVTTPGLTPVIDCLSELTTDKFVIGDGSTSLRVVQVNADGTLTYGALFSHSNPVQKLICVDATKIIGMRAVSVSQYEVMYFSVSGTTISFVSANSSISAISSTANSTTMSIEKIATGKACISYVNNSTTFGLRIVNVTGSLGIGAETNITPADTTSKASLVSYDTDKFCVFHGNGTSGNNYIWAVNVTGTSIAIGSAYSSRVPFTTFVSATSTFSGLSVGTSTIVFSGYSQTVTGTKSPFFEQISMSGTTVSFVKTLDIELSSTSTNSNVSMIRESATKILFLTGTASQFNSNLYEASNLVLKMTVSGSTVTLDPGSKTIDMLDYNVPTQMWNYIKVGTNFVSISGSSYAVFKPISITVYNFETPITTVTLNSPFTSNTVDIGSLTASFINDTTGYIKIKNNDTQTNAIRITRALVEME